MQDRVLGSPLNMKRNWQDENEGRTSNPLVDRHERPQNDFRRSRLVARGLRRSAGAEPEQARGRRSSLLSLGSLGILMALLCGCTSPSEYLHNGFKVGPNYCRPAAPAAAQWIDADDPRVRSMPVEDSCWWTVFNDPVLNCLVQDAYRQNLSLRQAAFRVLEARAKYGIAAGGLFPQTQQATASYQREAIANSFGENQQIFFNNVQTGFNLAWELDIWGRLRRAVANARANLDFSIEDYDAALVTLVADVGTTYVNMRTLQARVEIARSNVKIQQGTLDYTETRLKGGAATDLDVQQSRSLLMQTEAALRGLYISLRQSCDHLCLLLGIPPEDLEKKFGICPIPTAPTEVVVGIPADLLRNRPDVRRAERQLAAQSELIGIAAAEWYPHIAVTGAIGLSSTKLSTLVEPRSLTGSIGPSLEWNILNYGRILNNVRLQDATFQEFVANYQNAMLTANEDVEQGLVAFLQSQEQVRFQAQAADAAQRTVDLALLQFRAGKVDMNRVFTVERDLVTQQDTLALDQGSIATSLISVYRALGGGWQIRCTGDVQNAAWPPVQAPGAPAPTTSRPESLPVPSTDLGPVPQAPPQPAPQDESNVLPGPPQPELESSADSRSSVSRQPLVLAGGPGMGAIR